MRKLLLLAPLVLLLQACSSGPSLNGTWEISGMPQVSGAKHTFNSDGTNSMNASMEIPIGKIELIVSGTHTLADKTLTFKGSSVDVKGLPQAQAEQLKKMLAGEMTKERTGTVEWKGNDEFTLTTNGQTVTYKRSSK